MQFFADPSTLIVFSLAGALFQELLHWRELNRKLTTPEFQRALRSVSYWIITVLMLVMTPLVVGALANGDDSLPILTYMVMGAGAPLLFKKAVSAVTEDKPNPAPVADPLILPETERNQGATPPQTASSAPPSLIDYF